MVAVSLKRYIKFYIWLERSALPENIWRGNLKDATDEKYYKRG